MVDTENPRIDLGDFSLLLGSKGAETADKFTAQNINQVKVQWEPGKEFKNLLDDAEFNLVASRSAQAAVLKAIRDGKSTVDLNQPINPVMKVKVIKDFSFQNIPQHPSTSLNIPLSYKIRLNQVRPANKIHPYNHFSEYFFVFLQIYCVNMGVSKAYPT